MAKFRYSLQNILNIKEKMETQAKQEFGMAQTALNVEIEHLERLKARKREYEEESGGLLQGKLDLRAIEENKEALLKMDSLVAAQCIRVDKAKENVEAARERMAEAMKERKMHETLREKAFEAFLQEENHAESKAIDELTSYTYGQKKPAGGLRQREDINGKRKDSGRREKTAGGRKEKTEERTAGTAQGSKAPGKRNRKTGRCSG